MEGAAIRAAARGGLFLRSRARALLGGRPAFDHSARRLQRRNPRGRARRQWRADRWRPGADHRLPDHRGGHRLAASRRRPRDGRPCAGLRPGDRLRAGAGARAHRSAGVAARLIGRGRDRRTRGDRRRRRAHPFARRPHRRQAGIRRLLGIRAGPGDLHLSGASQLGRHRADFAAGRADRHRLLATRTRARGQERASQHGGADRSAQTDPRRPAQIRPRQQAGAALARALFDRDRGQDRGGRHRGQGPGGARRAENRRRDPGGQRRDGVHARATSTARSGRSAKPAWKSRSRCIAKASPSTCG